MTAHSPDHAERAAIETGEEACFFCKGPLDQQARSIRARLSQDHSFAALWERLDRAERDRDRMLNALQLVRSAIDQGGIIAKPKHKTLINRALSRIQPVRATLNDEGKGVGDGR